MSRREVGELFAQKQRDDTSDEDPRHGHALRVRVADVNGRENDQSRLGLRRALLRGGDGRDDRNNRFSEFYSKYRSGSCPSRLQFLSVESKQTGTGTGESAPTVLTATAVRVQHLRSA